MSRIKKSEIKKNKEEKKNKKEKKILKKEKNNLKKREKKKEIKDFLVVTLSFLQRDYFLFLLNEGLNGRWAALKLDAAAFFISLRP